MEQQQALQPQINSESYPSTREETIVMRQQPDSNAMTRTADKLTEEVQHNHESERTQERSNSQDTTVKSSTRGLQT